MAKRAKLKEDVPRDLYFGPKNVKFVSTGCTLLNLGISEKVTGGGWPLGRAVNIVGDKQIDRQDASCGRGDGQLPQTIPQRQSLLSRI